MKCKCCHESPQWSVTTRKSKQDTNISSSARLFICSPITLVVEPSNSYQLGCQRDNLSLYNPQTSTQNRLYILFYIQTRWINLELRKFTV